MQGMHEEERNAGQPIVLPPTAGLADNHHFYGTTQPDESNRDNGPLGFEA
jgi:hypothetical protein